MTDTITLTGIVGTDPRAIQTSSALAITSFRLASSQRRYDRQRSAWVDAETNWYTVTAFRSLAENTARSIAKGDRVIVSGRLRVRSWENGDRSGISVEVDAESIGHDLLWAVTTCTKNPQGSRAQDPEGTAPTPAPLAEGEQAPTTTSTLAADDVSAADDPVRELVAAGGPTVPEAAQPGVTGWHQDSTESPF